MANGGRIDYSIGFNVDKTGLNQIKSSLQEIKNLTAQDLMKIGGHTDIQKAEQELKSLKTSISQIDGALEKAFNTDLGTLNVSKFNQALKGMNLNQVYKDFSAAGAAGQAAFRNVTSQILTTNMQLKQTHNFLNNMATTMANTVKWGVASSVMNNFTGSVQKAYGYVKSLDTSLNDIRIVTGNSADEMERFAVKANNAAKALGQSTTNYTNAALIYYQQGLSDEDVAARAETTLKAANVTGQTGEAVSEQLTAVWNGYKVSAEEAELYIDKLAAVAATTASNLEELSTGMSKVASAANLMGVDADQLSAQLATIISVTRQAPESVGTALKTIYARMGDIEAGLDSETSLGSYTAAMKEMGINVLDANGKLRDMGSVIEEIGGKWSSMTREQQISLAQTAAGTRQYNNLLALFDGWDEYTKTLETSRNAVGTLQQQQDIYMESTQAHLNQLRAASEDLYDSLLDNDTVNNVADGLTFVVKRFTDLVDGIGGGNNTLLMLGSTATKVFSQQIAQGLATTIKNFQGVKYNAQQVSAQFELLRQFKDLSIGDKALTDIIGWKEQIMQLGSIVTAEENNQANAIMKTRIELENEADAWERKKKVAESYLGKTDIAQKPITGISEQESEAIISSLDTQIKKYGNVIEGSKRYSDSVSNLKNVIIDTSSSAEEYKDALADTKAKMDTLKHSSGDMLKTLNQQSVEYNELRNAIKEYNLALKSGDGNQIQAAAEKMVNAYKNAARRMQQEAKNTKIVVEQETNGTTENFKKKIGEAQQTWTQFINQLNSTKKIQSIVNIVGAVGQLVSVINTLSNIKDIINDESLTGAEKTLKIISALTMAIPMLSMALKTLKVDIGTLLVLTKLTTDAQLQEVGVSGALKAAWIAEDGVLKSLVTTLGIYALALAAVAGTVYLIVKAHNKEKDALEEANRAVQNQTAELERLKAAQEEVNRSLEAYENAAEKVKTLTEGTQEWRDAINEANSAALELLDKYPELASEIKNVNGELQISEEGLEKFSEAAAAEVNRAQTDLYLSKANQLDKENAYNAVETGRSIEYQVGNQQFTVADETINQVVEKINESGSGFLKDAESIQKELGINSQELAEALATNSEELTQLASEVAANTAAMQLYYGQAATGYLQNDEVYQNATAEQQAIIAEMAGAKLQEATEKIYNDTYKDEGLASKLDDATIQKMYAEQIGAEASKNKGKNLGEYLVDGEWKTISDETARMALAAAEAAGELQGLSANVVEVSDSLNQLGIEGDVQNAALGFMDGKTADLSQLNAEELTSLSNINFDNTLAQQMGYTGENAAQELMSAIDEAIGNEVERRIASLEEQIANAPDTINEKLNELPLSEEDALALNAAGAGEGLISSIDPEMWQEVISKGLNLEEVFNEIDWSLIDTTNPTEWFKSAFEQAVADAEYSKENEGDVESNYSKHAQEFDIDENTYRNLTKEIQNTADASDDLADSLETQEDAAQEVAKEILRYDKAVEAVNENGDDWLKTLKSGNMQDIAENIDAIADAYGNLLDVDPSSLSDGFLRSAENMELLQQAAQGSEEAYDSLMEKARQEIAITVGFDDTEFQNEFNSLMEQVGNPPLDELMVGADLDNGNFLKKLSEMVTAAGMTATEATNYLSTMGVDAKVKNQEQTVSEVVGHNVRAHTFTTYQAYSPGVQPDGTPITSIATYPEVMYSTEPVTVQKRISGTALEVTSAHKSSGGGIKFDNSSHGGGSKGAGAPRKGGGGGGGKSKGSQPKKAKKQDLMEKTVDRYREVNNELKKLENQMNRLTKAQDHLFGKDLYDNLNKQLKLLDKQVAATERKLELARQERRELQKQLENYGFNIQNYEIQNYEQRLEKYRKDVNDLIKQYNNLSGDEQQGEAGEALQEKIDAAQEKYDKVEELIEEWTNLQFDLIPELKETILDLAYQKIEIQLEKFNISVELNLDLRDAIADWHDFEKKIYGAADNLAESSQRSLDYINKIYDAGILEKQTEDLRAAREELEKIHADDEYISDIYTARDENGEVMRDPDTGKPITDKKAAMDEVERLQDELMSTIENIYDETDQILDNYVQSVEDLADAIDRYYDALEGVRDVIDHTMNMMKMIHGEDSSVMAQVYDKQLNSTKDLVQATKDNSAKLKGLISEQQSSLQDTNSKISNLQSQQSTQSSELEGMYKEDMTDEEKTAYENKKQELANTELQLANYERIKAAEEEALKTSEEAYQENLAMQRQYVEDYTQMLLEQYEYTINQASKKFTESLVGSMGMEGAQYEWDNLAREEDKYLDEINAAYELRKLERKINEDISGNDSVAAQQRLNKFKEEELKKLREKDKLTKYDVDRANQLYDIELKKIALLESQNNKSKMRLRRDASGNYSYQFVADEEDVAQKQQELDDATNELYNMDKDQYRKELQDLQALHKEYEDFRVWYSQQSAEFREANEAWYKQQCQMYEDQMVDSARLAEEAKQNTVESANMTIVNSSRDTMNEMTTMYNEAILEEILPTWRSSIAEMCEFINTSESSFRANSEEAMNAVFEASDQLISKLQELSNVVGGDLTEVTSQYYTNAEAEAKSYAQQQQENIDKTWEQVQANKALVDSMEDVLNHQQMQDAIGEVEDTQDTIEDITKDELEKVEEEDKKPAKQPTTPKEDDKKEDNKKKEESKGSLKVGEDITYKGSYYYDSYGTKPTGSKGAEVKNAVVIDKIVKNPKDGQKWSVHIKGNPKKDKYKGYTDLGWIKKSQITAYDTGGYTGAWNSRNGKMAMLHEKELVLNKEDTANILAVVKMVRDLVSMPYSNSSEEEYHIPLELQKVYDAILEKLDILTNSLISNEDLQASIENGLISDNEEDLLNEQLTTEDVLSDVEELENLTSTVGDELEEATTLLDGVQENLTSQMDLQNLQNFNLEELGLQQMDLFGSLENFMGTDFISQIESYIEDFKSQMSIQSDKSMMMSNEQLQGIQKQLETLAAQFMQEVNINAEFPNVTDSSEIQFAFDNMENEASQYALNTSGGAFNWMGSR